MLLRSWRPQSDHVALTSRQRRGNDDRPVYDGLERVDTGSDAVNGHGIFRQDADLYDKHTFSILLSNPGRYIPALHLQPELAAVLDARRLNQGAIRFSLFRLFQLFTPTMTSSVLTLRDERVWLCAAPPPVFWMEMPVALPFTDC